MRMVVTNISMAIIRESKGIWRRPDRENKQCHQEEELVKCQAKANGKTS